MKIRAYKDKDKQAVIALWSACGLVVPHNDPAKDIHRKLQVDRVFYQVCVNDKGIVATVMGGYEGHRGWINYLCVDPSERRKGYGETLMEAIEKLIKARGCPKINLQVRSTNRKVIAFYNAIGYNVDKVVSFGKRLEHDTN